MATRPAGRWRKCRADIRSIATVLLAAVAACSTPAPRLGLEEVSAHLLPDSFPVTRVVTSSQGTTVLFSPLQSHLLVGNDGRYEEFGAGRLIRPVGAVIGADGKVVQVVDAESRALLTFRGDEVTGSVAIPLEFELTSAVRPSSGRWYFGGVDSAGGAVVLCPNDGQAATEGSPDEHGNYVILRLARLSQDTIRDLVLSVADGTLVAFRQRTPAKLALVDPDCRARTVSAFAPDSRQFRTGLAEFLDPLWVGVDVTALDDHLLYTLADLRSSERRLLLLDPRGRLVRQRQVAAPMGFVARVPGSPMLLAVRTVAGAELVTYAWQWEES